MAWETSLAGISLGSKASIVLRKYGNPTRINVETVQAAVAMPKGGAIQPPTATRPGPTSPYPVPGTYAPSMEGAYSPYPVPPMTPAGLPPYGGMNAPGMPSYPGQPGAPGQDQGQQIIAQQEVTWTYELPKGDNIEMIISEDGRVKQITVSGNIAWLGSKTAKGVKIGDDYKSVVLKYGYPEGHIFEGGFLRAEYKDKSHCVFTFLDKKVVGVTIALPD